MHSFIPSRNVVLDVAVSHPAPGDCPGCRSADSPLSVHPCAASDPNLNWHNLLH